MWTGEVAWLDGEEEESVCHEVVVFKKSLPLPDHATEVNEGSMRES
jgi:hypothetical protein